MHTTHTHTNHTAPFYDHTLFIVGGRGGGGGEGAGKEERRKGGWRQICSK